MGMLLPLAITVERREIYLQRFKDSCSGCKWGGIISKRMKGFGSTISVMFQMSSKTNCTSYCAIYFMFKEKKKVTIYIYMYI